MKILKLLDSDVTPALEYLSKQIEPNLFFIQLVENYSTNEKQPFGLIIFKIMHNDLLKGIFTYDDFGRSFLWV